jgi:CheY-like chemotaxis protein
MTEDSGFVLVVDDDAVNWLLLSRALERDGHQVREVANGLQRSTGLAMSRSTVCCWMC